MRDYDLGYMSKQIDDLTRRLTALETRGTAAITPEGREVLASDAPPVATEDAEIARLTATEDTPLGFVNVYDGSIGNIHGSEDEARAQRHARRRYLRTVPVYEHPPRVTSRVTVSELQDVLVTARARWLRLGNTEGFDEAIAAELAPLLNRHAPPPQVVGACVMRDDVAHGVWTLRPQHYNESTAAAEAKEYGGTAHQLVLGAKIGEGA